MSSQAQKKILGIVRDMIAEHGLEAVTKPQWANTGDIHIEKPGEFGALAKVSYSFQDGNFTHTIYRCTGGRDVGVPSQPPRQGYFDHYLQYSDQAGFGVFQRHLRETMEAVAPKPKAPKAKPAPKKKPKIATVDVALVRDAVRAFAAVPESALEGMSDDVVLVGLVRGFEIKVADLRRIIDLARLVE